MKLLIKNGHIVDPKNKIDGINDILIDGQAIARIGVTINETADKVIDAQGLHIFPGLIDAHVHLREPGYEYKEDIYSGSCAAVAGGFTSIACMPNTNPINDNTSVTSYILQRAKEVGLCNIYPIAAITKNLKGEELSEMGSLLEAGAVAFSDDGKPLENNRMMRLALAYAKNFNALIISHCEDKALANGGVMHEGYHSTILGLKGIPAASEELMVAREIMLAEMLHTKVHIAHVSAAGSVELVREAKTKGIQVTCETCPHYFSLTDEAVSNYDTDTKVNPPLRSENDVKAIIEGLKDGTIDIIVTDHAPHHIDEKAVEYDIALSGISGLETSFALAYSKLVLTDDLSLSELIEKMSYKPSALLGINGGSLSVGENACFTIADLSASYEIDSSKFFSKGKNTPFNKMNVTGVIINTIYNGEIVFENGKILR